MLPDDGQAPTAFTHPSLAHDVEWPLPHKGAQYTCVWAKVCDNMVVQVLFGAKMTGPLAPK
jgi:hypothetical protein